VPTYIAKTWLLY